MLKELSRIQIVDSGIDDSDGKKVPFAVLKDETILYGQLPDALEKRIYFKNKNKFPSSITEDTIRVAMDVVLRYLYPHSMPHLTMPYPLKKRKAFHPQHVGTIEDIKGMSDSEKKELKGIYTPKKEESFLDIGAYMGYGVVRLGKELGNDTHIIAVEADPNAYDLLKRNVSVNSLSNVTLIQRAIWNQSNLALDMVKSTRQANSLISGIVDPNNTESVTTITTDDIINLIGLQRIDLIGLTVNGAEVEAVEGMKKAINNAEKIRLCIAGWYRRDKKRIYEIISPILRQYGLKVKIGPNGGVFAWK
ncbi:MAG: FkbM family methyltransferase [Candidatus Electrothrix sp. YB6]